MSDVPREFARLVRSPLLWAMCVVVPAAAALLVDVNHELAGSLWYDPQGEEQERTAAGMERLLAGTSGFGVGYLASFLTGLLLTGPAPGHPAGDPARTVGSRLAVAVPAGVLLAALDLAAVSAVAGGGRPPAEALWLAVGFPVWAALGVGAGSAWGGSRRALYGAALPLAVLATVVFAALACALAVLVDRLGGGAQAFRVLALALAVAGVAVVNVAGVAVLRRRAPR